MLELPWEKLDIGVCAIAQRLGRRTCVTGGEELGVSVFLGPDGYPATATKNSQQHQLLESVSQTS